MSNARMKMEDLLNPVFGGPRIPMHWKDLKYNRKVLVGEWFEETMNAEADPEPRCPGVGETFYQTDYTGVTPNPEAVQDSRNIVYDSAIRSLGQTKFIADVGYTTNFATLYDLTYNRAAPELNKMCGEELRTYKASAGGYQSERDYTNNYVGGVNKGYLACKKEEWQDDLDPESKMYLTTASENYTHKVLEGENRVFRRRVPINDSLVALDRFKIQIREFDSRGDAICFCVDHPEVCWVQPRNPKNILPTL